MRSFLIVVALCLVGACISKEITRQEMLEIISIDDSQSDDLDFDLELDSEIDLGLSYPGDCKSKTLRKFAQSCGLKVTAGGSHYIVKDPKTNQQITTIPHSVKANGTCRSIINVLNGRC